MTVSSSLNRKAYTGDGVTTSFSTSPVVFYDTDELDVYVVTTATGASTTLTENTHYTVSGGAGSTGTVSLAGGSSPYGAPSASQTLVIVRTLDLVQEFDPQNNDGSDANNIETAFDKLTMMAQQNAASVARAFRVADSDVSGASTEVPTPSANKLIGWNSAGTALENKAAADVDLTTVTAFIQTLLDDADAAATQATLLLGTKSTVACAATTADIWTGTGTLIDFTGSTGPVTDFPDAPRAGIQRILLCASTPTFTHNASQLVVPGGANYTAAAGDIIIVTAETTTKFRLSIFRADGTPIVTGTATTPRLLENIGLSVTMAANAVTIALKGADGNDPSSSNKVGIGFRNATLTNGQASRVEVTAALSTVISSGSTGGTVSGEASRIWIAAINNAGAAELAWFQSRSGTSIAPINEGGLISTTAEGGAGAADTAGTWYSTTARSNVPFTILGYFDSTQATAGTWATSPTSVVVNPKQRPGDAVQFAYNATGAVATGTTTIPFDDTIPQNTEGDQYMTQAITPTSAANVLEIEASLMMGSSAGASCQVAAIFQDSIANALAAAGLRKPDSSGIENSVVAHRMLAATTSSTTFKARGGSDAAGTTTFNGTGGTRRYGGVSNSFMRVTEISS